MARYVARRSGNFLDVIKYASLLRLVESISQSGYSSWTYLDLFPGHGKIKLDRQHNSKVLNNGINKLFEYRNSNNTTIPIKDSLNNFVEYLQDFNSLDRDNYNHNDIKYFPTSLDIVSSHLGYKDTALLYQYDPDKYKKLENYLDSNDYRYKIINDNFKNDNESQQQHIELNKDPYYLSKVSNNINKYIPTTNRGLAMIDFGNAPFLNSRHNNDIIGQIIDNICHKWPSSTKFITFPINKERPFRILRRICQTGQSNILVSEILNDRSQIRGMGICVINPPKYFHLSLSNVIHDAGWSIKDEEYIESMSKKEMQTDKSSLHQKRHNYIINKSEDFFTKYNSIKSLTNQIYTEIDKTSTLKTQEEQIESLLRQDDLKIHMNQIGRKMMPTLVHMDETLKDRKEKITLPLSQLLKSRDSGTGSKAALTTDSDTLKENTSEENKKDENNQDIQKNKKKKQSGEIIKTLNRLRAVKESNIEHKRPKAHVTWLTDRHDDLQLINEYDQHFLGYDELEDVVIDRYEALSDPSPDELSRNFGDRFEVGLEKSWQAHKKTFDFLNTDYDKQQQKTLLKKNKNKKKTELSKTKTTSTTTKKKVFKVQKKLDKNKKLHNSMPQRTNPKLFEGKLGDTPDTMTTRFLTNIDDTGANTDETLKILLDGRPSYLVKDNETLPPTSLQSTFSYNIQESKDQMDRDAELDQAFAYLEQFKNKSSKNHKS